MGQLGTSFGCARAGALDLFVKEYLERSELWEAVVLALTCRAVCKGLHQASAWAASANAMANAMAAGHLWRSWRQPAPAAAAAATAAASHMVKVEACLAALSAMHTQASRNRPRFWERVEARIFELDSSLQSNPRVSALRDADLVAAFAAAAPHVLERHSGTGMAARVDEIRAGRVGLAAYCGWRVSGFESRVLQVFKERHGSKS